MKTAQKIQAAVLLVCGTLHAIANGENEIERILKSIPSGPVRIEHGRGVSWAEYCPDETCDVIRTKQAIAQSDLAGFALAYFFYASNYSYLRSWKDDERLKFQVDSFLGGRTTGQCMATVGRPRAICQLRYLAKIWRIQALFVRHDERKTSVQALSLDESLK